MKKILLLLGLGILLFAVTSVSACMQSFDHHFVNNGYSYEGTCGMQRVEKKSAWTFELNQGAWAEPFHSSLHLGKPLNSAQANQYEDHRRMYQWSYTYFDNPQICTTCKQY